MTTAEQKVRAMKARAERKLAESRARTLTPAEQKARARRREHLQAKFASSMVPRHA